MFKTFISDIESMEELKKVACDAIDNAAAELHKLSDDIWNHPELGFQEKYAHQVLTQFLVKQGFQASCQVFIWNIESK